MLCVTKYSHDLIHGFHETVAITLQLLPKIDCTSRATRIRCENAIKVYLQTTEVAAAFGVGRTATAFSTALRGRRTASGERLRATLKPSAAIATRVTTLTAHTLHAQRICNYYHYSRLSVKAYLFSNRTNNLLCLTVTKMSLYRLLVRLRCPQLIDRYRQAFVGGQQQIFYVGS
jgi:hypothetical protein